MKFLITTKSRIGHNAHKPADPQAVFQAAHAWNRSRIDDGTLDCVYGHLDGRGGASIANAESHEQLLSMIRSSPMYHYMDYEIQPLCDLELLWKLQIDAATAQDPS
jgi:muconolactone delta-isomerase